MASTGGCPAWPHLLNVPHMKFKGAGIGSSEAEADISLVSSFINFFWGGGTKNSRPRDLNLASSHICFDPKSFLQNTHGGLQIKLTCDIGKETIMVTNEMCLP